MTESWTEAPSIDTCRRVMAAAADRGLVGPDSRAVLFHDMGLLERRLQRLREVFPPHSIHTVAIKANPLLEVLRAVVGGGFGLEAASIEEVHVGLAAGCPPDLLVYDSPAKTRAEITEALDLGVRMNVDNLDELARVSQLRSGSPSVLGVRINPMIDDGAIEATSVGGSSSRFGIPIDIAYRELPALLAENEWLRGLHVHVGSQGIALDQLVLAAERIERLRTDLNQRVGRTQIDTVDIGGGLPTSYVRDDAPPTLGEYVRALCQRAPGLFGDDVVLLTELGRALQANCGWAVSSIEYVKADGDAKVAVVHLGADFLVRPVYNPESWQHRFSVLEPERAGPASPWTVAGPLCFAGDVIARDVALPDPGPGDHLVVHDVGAYTLSMWSRHCSRGMPLVLGYREAGGSVELTVLRHAETAADVIRHWSRDHGGRDSSSVRGESA